MVCLLTALISFGKPADDVRPRVLLIGDSISIGYLESVRERLKDKADVRGLPLATKSSTQGLAEIDAHLTNMRWDVIHFNWGLNDLEHFGTAKQRVPLDLYEENLTKLVDKLEETGAVLIWATTTPIPKGTGTRTHGDAVKYNAVAAKVMQDRRIRINDLYAFALSRLADIQKPTDVHYTVEGYAVLGGQVARSVQLALAAADSQSFASLSIDVGLQKQLLVDDYIIAQKQNITREMGVVKKVGVVCEPSLETDFDPRFRKPDGSPVALSFGFCLSVVRNDKDDMFQMWYSGYFGVGYAESKDGIHWTKPLVGKDGKNNLVLSDKGFSCSLDPRLPWGDPEKYKGAGEVKRETKVGLCYSADGIHWDYYNDGNAVSHRAADTHNQLLWDPVAKKFRLLTRTDLGDIGGDGEIRSTRIMVHTAGNDLQSHPTAWKTVADKIIVDDPKKEKNKWGLPRLQFNAMTQWIYEGVYFGLMDVYSMDKSDMFDGFDYETRHDDDVMDFYIGTSRDGLNFDKSWIYARKPFVPRGPAGAFDKDGIKLPSQILTYKDEHWIYYGGMAERHYARGRDLKIGIAKLQLDRFICQRAKDKPGTITTKPFKLEGDTLQLNVDAQKGRFHVEVLDADGKPIPGFTINELNYYGSVDDLRLKPQWKNNKDMSSLKGQTIRLKFYLYNAKLYAFQIFPACLEKQIFDSYGLAGKTHLAVTPEDRTGSAWWLARHQQVLEHIAQGNIDLIMVGDSITHNWDSMGKKVWDQYYASRNAVNMGFGGDGTESVIWRFDNGEIDGINPKLAVLMIGTNNSNGDDHTPEEIADGIKAICARMRAKMPKTKILILAIFPRGFGSDEQRAALGHGTTFNSQWDKNNQASRIVSRIADGKHIFYLDINEAFLDGNGLLTREVMPDFVHLSEKGYRIWAEALEPTVVKLMGEK
jgi:lysophospholipase L1-like esterase